MSSEEMNNELHDERLSKLYRQAAHEEPAMGLDSTVLRQARKAVAKADPWWKRGWLTPLATVAVVMLTASLLIQMKQQHPEIVAPASIDEYSPVYQPAPAHQATPQSAGIMADELHQQEPAKAQEMKPAAPAPAKERAATVHAMQAAPLGEASDAAKKPEMMSRSRVMKKDAEAEPAAPEADVSPASQRLSDHELKGALSGSSRAKEQNEKSNVKKTQTMEGTQVMKKLKMTPEPAPWIEHIRSLLKQGKKDEARKEIVAFKAAYPDYKLPADLTDPQ